MMLMSCAAANVLSAATDTESANLILNMDPVNKRTRKSDFELRQELLDISCVFQIVNNGKSQSLPEAL